MAKSPPNPMHPKRWTAITWLGIFLWLWGPSVLNLVPSVYSIKNDAGEWEETTIANLSDLPFAIGWPFHYVVPNDPFPPSVPVRVGVALPAPGPADVYYGFFATNILLIALATAALVYCLQTLFPRFTLRTVFAVTLIVALYFGLLPHVTRTIGFVAGSLVVDGLYFSPIVGVIAILTLKKFNIQWSTTISKIRNVGGTTVDHNDPEEVLAHASQLDKQGRWEEAIDVYRSAALKWPQQATYIRNCITAIEEKKST